MNCFFSPHWIALALVTISITEYLKLARISKFVEMKHFKHSMDFESIIFRTLLIELIAVKLKRGKIIDWAYLKSLLVELGKAFALVESRLDRSIIRLLASHHRIRSLWNPSGKRNLVQFWHLTTLNSYLPLWLCYLFCLYFCFILQERQHKKRQDCPDFATRL